MSRRQKSVPEEKPGPEPGPAVEEDEPVPETRRTRSGRTVRTPAALLNSEPPVRTPTRRTRRSVLQELPAVEEKNTEEPTRIPETLPEEEKPRIAPPEPEPCAVSEPVDTAAEPDTGDAEPVRPEPAETVPKTTETTETSDTAPPSKKPRLAPNVTQIPVVPLGKPKSGRVWKNRNKQRFSALVRDKPLCSSWEKKMQNKREKELVKQFSQQLKDEDARKKEEKRKRREDNLKRRAENERKAEIVQVIRNTSKIKRMKKKQLRKIEKRDTLALLQKSQKQNVKTKGQKNKTDKDLT